MKVTSLLVCVGEKYYKLHQVINEYKRLGVSKRIAATSIPEGLQEGVSKVFVAHPRAIVNVSDPKTLRELADFLYQWHYVGMMGDPLEEHMLSIAYALSELSEKEPGVYANAESTFGLTYQMGIIGYAPFSGFQLVLKESETDLPTELDHMRPLVDAGVLELVHVVYEEGSNG